MNLDWLVRGNKSDLERFLSYGSLAGFDIWIASSHKILLLKQLLRPIPRNLARRLLYLGRQHTTLNTLNLKDL